MRGINCSCREQSADQSESGGRSHLSPGRHANATGGRVWHAQSRVRVGARARATRLGVRRGARRRIR
eukprot:4072285-Lingulodinium_polyedra.AAC.1